MCVCGCGCVRLHPSILHTTAGRVPAARAAGGEFVRAFRRLRGEGRRSVALPGLFPVRGRRGEEDEVEKIVGDLLPKKPTEIAIDDGISRRIGGVLGIVFN